MQINWTRVLRWLTLVATGGVVFQNVAGCDLALQFIQTGLLGGIGGLLIFLAKNI